MRQLDTCDFCGDAAEGVYEVVPASVAGEPKRLALCAACRTTLQSVVDPLLDAASAAERTADVSEREAEAEPTDDATTADDATPSAATADEGQSTESASPSDTSDSEGVTIEVGGRDDDEDDADDEPSAGGSPARRPSGYAQLVRLLQNRDGAMPREDLRALATNAYDLGGTEFEDAVEAAIENGDVEETAGGLQTT